MKLPLHLLALVVCACAGVAQAAPLDPANVAIRLTDLGPGVIPTAINNVGQVAGQGSNGQAFRWESGLLTSHGTLGGSQSYANNLNDSGVVVGWSLDGEGKQKSFKWENPATEMVNIDSTVPFEGAAEAINNSGAIVGWRTDRVNYRSFRWEGRFFDGQALFGGNDHKALGINNAGEVVGITLDDGEPLEAFYWDGFDPVEYTSEIGSSYAPFGGINANRITAGQSFGSTADYLVIGEPVSSYIGSLHPSDPFSISLSINDMNIIVGESGQKGFVYDVDSQQLVDINNYARHGLQVTIILRLTDINNSNAFVGVATINGIEHGIMGEFVAVPEPGAFVLIVMGAIAALLIVPC